MAYGEKKAYRQLIHETAQRVENYVYNNPQSIPLEIRADVLELAYFGTIKDVLNPFPGTK